MDSSYSWDSCLVSSQNFEKSIVFDSIFLWTAAFPLYIPEILRIIASKGHPFGEVVMYRVDISEISILAPPVNHFYL